MHGRSEAVGTRQQLQRQQVDQMTKHVSCGIMSETRTRYEADIVQ